METIVLLIILWVILIPFHLEQDRHDLCYYDEERTGKKAIHLKDIKDL